MICASGPIMNRPNLLLRGLMPRRSTASFGTTTSFLASVRYPSGTGPPTQSPLRFEAAILSRTRSPSSQRAHAKVDEGPFASLNATRRKLTAGTGLAISVLHLIENRLDVAAAGLQWTRSSRLPRPILAIAAGADFEHLALPRYWPDRSISLDKGVSHRDSLAKYAVAYFECMTWPLGGAGRAPGGP